jgi:acyl-CoA thioesterase II
MFKTAFAPTCALHAPRSPAAADESLLTMEAIGRHVAAPPIPRNDMPATAADLVARLDLETIEVDIFRGRSPQNSWTRVFGGQVIAQALVAAARTVEGRAPHSLHGYFILPGDPLVPIVFEVDRIRDGKSFTTRRVVAIQHGKAIFSLSASFQVEEQGVEHSMPMPAAPDPDALADPIDLMRLADEKTRHRMLAFADRIRPIEIRPIDLSRYAPGARGVAREPRQSLWIRIAGRLPDDPAIHRAALAFLSDMSLIDTALVAHGFSVSDPEFQVASLDHALWFHRPFRADEWMLYAQDSPNSGGSRGLTRGLLYSRSGVLVASVAQEGLIRRRREGAA